MPGAATLDEATADRFAGIALGHVERAYPHVLSHVFEGPADARTPEALHPVFFGSFDWHSCVHGYWMLATVLRQYPGMAQAGAIRALFDRRLMGAAVEGECAYFRRGVGRGFERPYGWAWTLALQHALRGTAWAERLRPLAEIVAGRFRAYLPKAQYPVRVGTHFNTAFALVVSAAYAEACDPALAGLLRMKAGDWYGGDAGCQAWEPGQDDFLSSALTEAVCMKRFLGPEAFAAWFRGFLPEMAAGRPATLFAPAMVSDRSDGKIAHLDGLNLSRAWCWRVLGSEAPAQLHLDASMAHVAGDFMGEHWLATFAVLALWPESLD